MQIIYIKPADSLLEHNPEDTDFAHLQPCWWQLVAGIGKLHSDFLDTSKQQGRFNY